MYCSNYKNMLAVVTRRLPSWSPNDAGYSHLLGMQAYGMQAAGWLDAAEALAEKTLSMNGNDRWACKLGGWQPMRFVVADAVRGYVADDL